MPLESRPKDDAQGAEMWQCEPGTGETAQLRAGLDLPVAASIGAPSPEYSQSADQ